jgi:DNA-binding MarR family transcriptional regulator
VVLYLEHPTAMRALAEHLACDASSVTGLADRLEELGVLERVPGQDRRVKLLRLTSRGAALRADIAQRVAHGSTVTAKLSGSERGQLAALLDKLLR